MITSTKRVRKMSEMSNRSIQGRHVDPTEPVMEPIAEKTRNHIHNQGLHKSFEHENRVSPVQEVLSKGLIAGELN